MAQPIEKLDNLLNIYYIFFYDAQSGNKLYLAVMKIVQYEFAMFYIFNENPV